MLPIAVFLFLLKEYNCYLVAPKHGLDTRPGFNLEVNPGRKYPINSGPVPESYDWRDYNMVSPVKDQSTCNACWAFSVIANIESHLKIYRDLEETLSEQFLIDCNPAAVNGGCNAASTLQTFGYIVGTVGGVLRNSDYYPYESQPNHCRYKKPTEFNANVLPHRGPTPVPVVGFRRVRANEKEMAEFVYKYGPLTAGITSDSMARYTGGIDQPSVNSCDPNKQDHSVLIVGYGVYESPDSDAIPYWIIKNSWGTDWGEDGYYYLERGRNACGIANEVAFPFVN